MHQTFRRFAAAVSLIMILATTPAVAAPSRDSDPRDRSSIVRIVNRIIKKLFGITPTATVEPPIPLPDPNNRG